jgi:hypothetical protein
VSIWKVEAQAAPFSANLFVFPFVQAGIVVHYLRCLAAVQGFPAPALARLPFTMNQAHRAQGVPSILARAEGSPSLFLGFLKLVLANVAFDDLLWTVAQLLLQVANLLLEPGHSRALLADQCLPQPDVNAVGLHCGSAVIVTLPARALAVPAAARPAEICDAFVPGALAA